MKAVRFLFVLFFLVGCFSIVSAADHYQNFEASIYTRVYEVLKMKDPDWLKTTFDQINNHVKVDKIYLETHRDMVVIEDDELVKIIQFFKDRGIETAGGITITVNERNNYETYCYTNPEHRKKLKEVVEFTARHFDEIILDDFFFTSCKCENCVKAKGDKSWSQFRMDLLDEAARTLILEPARAVNPNVKVVIKYPNWYEHFQELGFDLEREPKLFDGIYTGTETRDARTSNQHLQPYQGYLIVRYFENIAPGRNGGGWVDTGGSRYAERYAEQFWMTLLAKAPEMTLFDYRQMLWPLRETLRGDWQGTGTTLDFDAMVKPYVTDGGYNKDATMALVAETALDLIDPVLGYLGNPIGLKSYKPFHSTGEDFLHNYLGMIGIPMDLCPEFPAEADLILLTECAKFDPDIVDKIEKQLMDGKDVVITSGLLKALQRKGLGKIVDLEYTGRQALVKDFKIGRSLIVSSDKEILIPQIQYFTNDSWEIISALDGVNGWPLLHRADYTNGDLYVLTIPDNFADLYALPGEILNALRNTLAKNQCVRLIAPSNVSLFLYDNQTAVVYSFRDEPVDVKLVAGKDFKGVNDILSGASLQGEPVKGLRGQETGETAYGLTVKPHSYRVFKVE